MGVRSLVAAVLCFLTFFTIAVSASNQDLTGLTLTDIPACGLQCLIQQIPTSGCLPTDIDCVCQNDDITHATAACMLANCTMQDSLDTSRVQADLCNLSNESKSNEIILYTTIIYSVVFVSVALRFVSKILSKRLSWDDLAVLAALLIVTVPLGVVLDMAGKGFGEHLWNLRDGMLTPILLRLYISWSVYVVVLCMIKVSLVLFYLEIFTTPRFRKIAYIALAFIVTNSVVIFFLATLPCRPMASFWDRDIKNGKCINIQAAAYANSASALVQDIILLALPIAFIRNLQMKRYRKIAVGVMFCIGTFGAVATLMRLPSLASFKISIDPTWDYVSVTKWSQLELAAGFICVSLPSVRVLIAMIIPARVKDMLSMNTTSKSNSKSGSNPHVKYSPKSQDSQGHNDPQNRNVWGNVSEVRHDSITAQEKEATPKTRGRFIRTFWPRSPPAAHTATRSKRAGSASSNCSVAKIAATAFPFRDEGKHADFEMTEAWKSRGPGRDSCRTYDGRDDNLTALPYMGCIPERTYSQEDFSRSHHALQQKEMV